MEIFRIEGGKKLDGCIKVQGSKNSALPILSACVLTTRPSVIHNCPRLSDIDAAVKILEHIGCKVKREDLTVYIDPSGANNYSVPDELMREMRSSIVFLGALIGRFKAAEFSSPGGCEIGLRPIDLHIRAMKALGAEITNDSGRVKCTCPNGLKAHHIIFPFPSVGATENAVLAASTALGTTVLTNCAREPEIVDLCDFLNSCGAKIVGSGEGTIIIEGVDSLGGAEHTVIPDRIVAATYMASAGITGGAITLKNVIPSHLRPVIPSFSDSGCSVVANNREVSISAPRKLRRIPNVVTMPYPGFPTDAQAPIMAMTTIARGTSVFLENIFESRFKHVSELNRFGANIRTEGRMAVVEGVDSLHASTVTACDLRGGAALVVAALAAYGTSEIAEIHHIDRGYEDLEKVLCSVGADIQRIRD